MGNRELAQVKIFQEGLTKGPLAARWMKGSPRHRAGTGGHRPWPQGRRGGRAPGSHMETPPSEEQPETASWWGLGGGTHPDSGPLLFSDVHPLAEPDLRSDTKVVSQGHSTGPKAELRNRRGGCGERAKATNAEWCPCCRKPFGGSSESHAWLRQGPAIPPPGDTLRRTENRDPDRHLYALSSNTITCGCGRARRRVSLGKQDVACPRDGAAPGHAREAALAIHRVGKPGKRYAQGERPDAEGQTPLRRNI